MVNEDNGSGHSDLVGRPDAVAVLDFSEELFEYACSITLAGIRDQFPGLSDEECRRILEERLDLREQLEKRG